MNLLKLADPREPTLMLSGAILKDQHDDESLQLHVDAECANEGALIISSERSQSVLRAEFSTTTDLVTVYANDGEGVIKLSFTREFFKMWLKNANKLVKNPAMFDPL